MRVGLLWSALLFVSVIIAGCGQEPPQEPETATASVLNADDLEQELGTVTFELQDGEGVVGNAQIAANGVISQGDHAIHIHENADCSPADTDGDGTDEPAGAAGGHFDPTEVGHGEDNGPHVGDSDDYNYTFAANGSFTGDVAFPLATFSGNTGILENGGTAIVIHQGTDDMTTDPSGQSGPRIACGVISEDS